MTKSTITREQLLEIIETDHVQCGEASYLARMALAAMGSEPHTDDELSNLLWYSQEATCHSDPNYYCEFQRLATPGLIAGIIRELQERRKAERDSEPVAWRRFQETPTDGGYWILYDYKPNCSGVEPLYRHAQPAPEKYNIGDATMRHIFTPTGMTNVSDMQAVFDRVEAVLVGMNQQAPVVPDGYVMVPKEPTKQMILAGQEELESCIDNGFDSDIDGNRYDYTDIVPDAPHRVFMAMLAAAPQEVPDER